MATDDPKPETETKPTETVILQFQGPLTGETRMILGPSTQAHYLVDALGKVTVPVEDSHALIAQGWRKFVAAAEQPKPGPASTVAAEKAPEEEPEPDPESGYKKPKYEPPSRRK